MAADVAQPVEQRFRKAWVACSSQVIGFGVNPCCSRLFRLEQVFYANHRISVPSFGLLLICPQLRLHDCQLLREGLRADALIRVRGITPTKSAETDLPTRCPGQEEMFADYSLSKLFRSVKRRQESTGL